MVDRSLRTSLGQPQRTRGVACVALVVLLLFSILLGMAAIGTLPAAFTGHILREDQAAANALGWPLPGEARLSAPQAPPLHNWLRLFVPVILLLMVPVGWMAPPGFRSRAPG